jgi:hypothetical protein
MNVLPLSISVKADWSPAHLSATYPQRRFRHVCCLRNQLFSTPSAHLVLQQQMPANEGLYNILAVEHYCSVW